MAHFDFARANPLVAAIFWLFAAPPAVQDIEVDDESVRIRMGWIFVATIPRAAIASARPDDGRIGGIGAHGWAGRWLVNTSGHGLVRIEIDPAADVRGRAIGVPVQLRRLRISLADPQAFLAAVNR